MKRLIVHGQTMMLAMSLSVLALLCWRAPVHAQTTVPGGTIGSDVTWTLAGSPYLVQGSVTVGANATLTIEPGVAVRTQGAHLLQVAGGGTLIAEGTVEQPITFTTHSATPAPGAWNYLMFETGSRGTLRNCAIEYAGAGNYAAIYLRSSSVTVHSCRIQRNRNERVQVTNATPHLRFNQINDNGFGVRNTTPALVINATSNWWGSYLGPHHPVLNRYGKGNAVSNGVHFDPWSLSESVGAVEIRALDAAVPAEVSNLGRATLGLIGAGFHLMPTVQLLAPDGKTLSPINLTLPNQFLMRATFDFTDRPLGAYTVRVDWAGGHAETLGDAVRVVEGKGGNVWAKLNVPGAVRSGRSFLFTLEYGNDGDSDAPAPWLTVQTSPGMRWQVLDGDPISTPTFNLMAINPDGDGGDSGARSAGVDHLFRHLVDRHGRSNHPLLVCKANPNAHFHSDDSAGGRRPNAGAMAHDCTNVGDTLWQRLRYVQTDAHHLGVGGK